MHSLASYTQLPQYPPPPRTTRPAFDSSLDEPHLLSINCGRTRTKTLAAVLTGCFLVFLVIYRPSQPRTERQQALLAQGTDLFKLSQEGWEPYEPPDRRGGKGRYTDEQLSTWADRLSSPCADLLVADGQLCDEAKGFFAGQDAVDLLWTWTNGSDPLLRRWKADVTTTLSGKVKPARVKVKEKLTAKHFRDHDELRYSVRSALSAFIPSALRKLHLLTTDLPSDVLLSDLIEGNTSIETVQLSRAGQIPVWLNRSATAASPPLEISHHSTIFDDSLALPTFNSLSIESQFPHLDTAGEFALYLNDDTFLLDTHKMTAADVGAPLLGPVFRIQTDLTVDGRSPSTFVGAADGEWASLRRANYLLNLRFGRRSRGYLAHIPKTLSMPLLREMSLIWHDELLETASSRFRGRRTEYQLAFLATHFVIEAHREALLHAFFLARSDRDLNGSLSLTERRTMLAELGFPANEPVKVQVPFPRRSTRSGLPHLLRRAGLSSPGETGFAFSSFDGFGMGTIIVEEEEHNAGVKRQEGDKGKDKRLLRSMKPPRRQYLRPVLRVNDADEPLDAHEADKEKKVACTLDLDECFGPDFLDLLRTVSAKNIFRRVAFEKPECGDCVIVALVGKSGRSGLSAFLPDCNASSSSTSSAFTIPPSSLFTTSKTFSTADLPLSLSSSSRPTCSVARAFSIRRILRCTYILGDSQSWFIPMQSARVTEKALDKMVEQQEKGEKLPTFLTLNDDFKNDETAGLANAGLRKFFEQQWPDPSPYEKQE